MTLLARSALFTLALGSSVFAQQLLYQIECPPGMFPSDESGVVGLGDVDGDGVQDFAIAGTVYAGGSWFRVYSGRDGSVLWDSPRRSDYHLGPLAALGDVDGDGHDDFLSGNAVYSGRSFTVLHLVAGEIGPVVTSVPDLDGDGVREILHGNPEYVGHCGGDLCHFLVSGPGFATLSSGATGALLHRFNGGSRGQAFGGALSTAGDFDGDGVDDLFIGSAPIGIGQPDYYRWGGWIYSGATLQELFYLPLMSYGFRGVRGAPLGDLNGDGKDELLVTEPAAFGLVRVHAGGTGELLYSVEPNASPYNEAYNDFGYSPLSVGDVDGDNLPDFAVGAPEWTRYGGYFTTEHGPGFVRLMSGRDGSTIHEYIGQWIGGSFGQGVTSLGDLDGDGREDLVILATTGAGGTARPLYAFSTAEGFDQLENFCAGSLNTAYTRAHLDSQGAPSVSSSNWSLTVDGATPGTVGLFRYSSGRAVARLTATYTGYHSFRCLDLPAALLPGLEVSDGSGHVQRSIDLTAPGGPFAAGTTWHFQYFFRDGVHAGTSDGLSVTFTP